MKKVSNVLHTTFTVMGIILCAILVPMLAINISLIVKSLTSGEVPSIGGVVPQIVLTGSMSPEIDTGDLIFSRQVEAEDVKTGDVISFYDPASNADSVVTHRVVSVVEDEEGRKAWRTKGDANNAEDETPVPFKNLVAAYSGVRIPKAGNIVMYMQTSTGFIFIVLIPFMIFMLYDQIRRMIYEKKKKENE